VLDPHPCNRVVILSQSFEKRNAIGDYKTHNNTNFKRATHHAKITRESNVGFTVVGLSL
jgi:hypothetical protein